MSDGTHIEWTDATLNVVNGCTVVSPGCENCYAMRLSATRLQHHPSRAGLARMHNGHAQWTGEVRFNEKVLLDPLRWRRPRKIFWNAHGDLFHPKVPDEWIDRCFAVMALTPHHIHQVLTKRPERMRDYVCAQRDNPRYLELPGEGRVWTPFEGGVMKCIWLGVSIEDQPRADERIPLLLDTPAAVRWLSCEPLLGPVTLCRIDTMHFCGCEQIDALNGDGMDFLGKPMHSIPKIDWVVVGGESGPGARPMHSDWARSLRDQCAAAAVPFLHKQNGEFAPGEIAGDFLDSEKTASGLSLFDGRWIESWSNPDDHCDDEPDVYRIGKRRAGRLLDGVQHDGYPA